MTPALPALPGTLSIAWGLGTVAAVIGAGSAFIIATYRRGQPLRQELRARPVTYTARVDVRGFNYRGFRAVFDLIVHGDMFEVSAVPLPGLLGDQWIYRARETTMQVVPGWQQDWIEIAAQPPAGRARPMRISAHSPCSRWDVSHSPWMTHEIWDALARAGVHPASAPPQ